MRRLLVSAFLLLACAAPATAASWFELNFGLSGPRYDARVPLCDDPGVLSRISSRFASKEGEFWSSNLEILGIDRVREAGFRTWDAQAIPRRFCSGLARLSDSAGRSTTRSARPGLAQYRLGIGMVRGRLDRNCHNPLRMARP